jgi:branched-chain amino acid transport system ATP-binding protein
MSTPALQVTQLRKSFGGLPVTQDVSFSVMPGERRLILGPNGAGKTTLFNLITGDLRADSGSIKLFGTEMSQMGVHQRTHLSLARTYQIITLFNKDSLLHNVVLSLMGLSKTRWNAFSNLMRYSHFEQEAMRVLSLVGLDRAAHRPVSDVAYGDKRMLEIAMAMAQKPKLLLLDEPLAGLSKEERVRVSGLVASIPRETTVVMIEHDMDTALELAEKLLVLHYGKVIVDGDRDDVVHDERTKEVYLGS